MATHVYEKNSYFCNFKVLHLAGVLHGVFTLPDTETDTDTDKKWVVKNCVEVFTLHCTVRILLVLVSVSVSVLGSVKGAECIPRMRGS